jgi:hypothetical protein
MRRTRHVADVGEDNNACRYCWDNLVEIHDLEDLGVDGRTTLNLILNKQEGRACTVFIWLRIGTSGGLLQIR